jgi:hypothetical protein
MSAMRKISSSSSWHPINSSYSVLVHCVWEWEVWLRKFCAVKIVFATTQKKLFLLLTQHNADVPIIHHCVILGTWEWMSGREMRLSVDVCKQRRNIQISRFIFLIWRLIEREHKKVTLLSVLCYLHAPCNENVFTLYVNCQLRIVCSKYFHSCISLTRSLNNQIFMAWFL